MTQVGSPMRSQKPLWKAKKCLWWKIRTDKKPPNSKLNWVASKVLRGDSGVAPAGNPYPAPSFEGAFTFVQNPSNCLESQASKVFEADSGVAPAGNPYPAPSFEGALLLCKILAGAWSPKHPSCFVTQTEGPFGPSVHTFSPAWVKAAASPSSPTR